jgi:hypothetical protein
MGSITRFDLNRIIRDYKSSVFFETGTFRGDGLAYALQSPFKNLVSVEIVPEIANEAKKRFNAESRVEIIETKSITALNEKLPHVNSNCIFWLDAHFPGADAGMTRYDAGNDETLRLPLAFEIEAIRQRHRSFKNDVLILDDLRIYEDGPYERGNVPADALPTGNRNIDFVFEYFGRTHIILRSYLDEGYLLVFPKSAYRRKHFSLQRLFTKQLVEDFYLKG